MTLWSSSAIYGIVGERKPDHENFQQIYNGSFKRNRYIAKAVFNRLQLVFRKFSLQ